jgi:CHRD domain
MQKRFALLPIAAAIVVVAAACGKDSTQPAPPNTVTFKATLSSANEVPANTSTGTGTFTGTLDQTTNVFTYDVTFTGLSANVTLGHIHGPAAAGVNANPTLNFATLPGATFTTGVPAGSAHGSVTLTAATTITATINGDSLKKLLFAGQTYANIHTTTNTGGEIRGQITKQ